MEAKKRGRQTTIVLIILGVIAVSGVVFGMVITRAQNQTQVFVSIETPFFNTPMISATTDERHTVQTEFSVNLDRNVVRRNGINSTTLTREIQGIISEMDFDIFRSPESIALVQNGVRDALSASLPPDAVGNVFITNINSGGGEIFEIAQRDAQRDRGTVTGFLEGLGRRR